MSLAIQSASPSGVAREITLIGSNDDVPGATVEVNMLLARFGFWLISRFATSMMGFGSDSSLEAL